MKKLLLLFLLLPLFAVSQDKHRDAYNKDCFNDSINIHTALRIDCWLEAYRKDSTESVVVGVCLNPYHYQYVHRKPTEDGFIEFLKVMPKGGL